ncbi:MULTISPECIES: tail fiber protein [Serratia]|uniref:tail fiber protein n=1 Tax=Serratia TaxID=613 RepID=UPI00066149DC
MYFLDNNSGTPDMPPLAPVQSHAVLWFTEGDKQKGISWPGQDWFNGFQAEHLNVLAEAGIVPDKTKLNQLTLAIKKLVSSGITTDIKDATTTQKGIVQLSSATNSTSETLAATSKAVKAAYDRPGVFGLGLGPVAKTDAYSNIAQFYRVNTSSANAPPITGNIAAGVVSLPCDAAPSTGYLAVSGVGDGWLGRSGAAANGVTWTRIFTEKNPPTAVASQAADWRNNFAARLGIARVLTGANKPTSPGVWAVENSTWTPVAWGTLYVTTNNSDLGVPSASGKYIHYLFIAHGATNKFFVATDVNGQFVGWEGYLPTKGGTLGGILKTNSEIQSTSANLWRGIQGDYGSMWRMDANNSYFLLTNKGDQNGNFNNLRPFSINNATGAVSIGTSLSVDSLSSIYKAGINSYNSGGTDYRQTNGLTMQGLGDQVAEVYLLEAVGSRTVLGLHVRGGGTDGWFECRNNGSLYMGGSWPVIQNSAGTTWHSDGNIQGAAWGNDYLSNYLNNNFGRKFTASAGENGWRRDPDTGIIEQWMYCEGNQGGAPKGQWFNFPMAFPGACLNIQLTCLNSSNAQSTYPPQVSGTKPSNTGVNVCFGSNEWRFYVRATGV